MNIALIGYGAWGSHHAEAIRETAELDLIVIVARTEASRNRAAAGFPGSAVTGNYREALERSDVDAVDIVLPSHLHHEVALAALKAGKHVLLEKPMAIRLEHCRELVDVAARNGLVLAVGHEFRLSSQWGEIRAMIERGEIGEPHYVLVELSRRPYRLGADGWRYDIERVGNWILEEPIHFFDLARWYLTGAGPPAEVFAAARGRDDAHPELQDNFSATVRWPNGSYAVVTQTLNAFEHHQTVKVTGSGGALWAGWSGALDRTERPSFFLRVMRGHGTDPEDVPLEAPSGEFFELRREIRDFTEAIRTGRTPAATGLDGLWATGLCLAAQQSVDRRRIVDLAEFMGPYLASADE